MTSEFAGLQVHNGTTVVHLLSTGTELSGTILAWAALTADDHGATGMVASTTTGRITLVPGTYLVHVDLSLENQTVSGLSSEDITVQDVIDVYLAKGTAGGQNPTEISGTRSRVAVEEGLAANLHITAIVEITKAMLDSSINYISVFGKTALGGATASDVLITQARFQAIRLD